MKSKPNTQVTIHRNGRAKVTVGDAVMVGVLGAELRKTNDGVPSWFIEVSSRFVNCKPEPVDEKT